MKSLVFLFSLLCASASAGERVTVSLDQVAEKVGKENYLVLENAYRVYQAKESIQVARGNLLPRLNLWSIAEIAFDWASVAGMVEDIAPFLVPANWFRLEEQKLFLLVQKEAYRALLANEVMTAKTLFYQVLLDQSLLKHIEEQREQLEEVKAIVQSRELLGGARPGTSRDIEIRLLGLEEDRRALEVLLLEERSLLAYLMGLGGVAEPELVPVALPELSRLKPLEYEDFEFRTLDSAPELREYGHLIRAADLVKSEVAWSFLGASSQSRGVAGGVFDGLPLQQGLGFGTAASIRIVKAQKEILKVQAKGVEETLRRQLRLLVGNYNLDLEYSASLKRRVQLTQATLDELHLRMQLGEWVEIDHLIETSKNNLQAKTAFFGAQYRFLIHQEKLARLIFHGDYSQQPAEIGQLEGKP